MPDVQSDKLSLSDGHQGYPLCAFLLAQYFQENLANKADVSYSKIIPGNLAYAIAVFVKK
jgi:hypothetical protein